MRIKRIVPVAEALEYECPRCLVPAGTFCVYVMASKKSKASPLHLGRVGTTSNTLHNDRFNAAREANPGEPLPSAKLHWADPYALRNAEAIRSRLQLQRLQTGWDLDEYMAMYEWLKRNSRLLTDLGPRPR